MGLYRDNDGGAAFPLHIPATDAGSWDHGMSLRDYFAIHCDQPGQAEIVTAAGLTYSVGQVWVTGDASLGTFDKWYASLPQERRFQLYATVRYALADAMLKAREQ
jgi:hypothetical protein